MHPVCLKKGLHEKKCLTNVEANVAAKTNCRTIALYPKLDAECDKHSLRSIVDNTRQAAAKFQSLGQSHTIGKYPNFGRYPDFFKE